MSEIQQSPQDNYGTFRYQLRFEDTIVAGFTDADNADSAPVKQQNSSDGKLDYKALAFTRGLSRNSNFLEWCNITWEEDEQNSQEVDDLGPELRNFTLLVLDEDGNVIRKYSILKAWSSHCEFAPEMDSSSSESIIESLILQINGILKIK